MSAQSKPKFAVFGNPIEQSKSPLIHQLFADQLGMQLSYTKILGQLDDFSASLAAFFAQPEAQGCNVTAPFKGEAANWVDQLTPLATEARAVNTIVRLADGRYLGDTTDGRGLVADLVRQGVQLQQATVLLIGAGGAASGVITPLLSAGVKSIEIANRSPDKAIALSRQFAGKPVTGLSLQQLNLHQQPYTLIINCTSASLDGALPQLSDDVLGAAQLAYDMVYLPQPTVFMRQAQQLGVKQVSDGLGMLVGQAAHSFKLWHQVMPDITSVLAQLRSRL